jgi:hypothetical protein
MMRRIWLAALPLALVAPACSGGDNGTDPPPPVPGTLTVSLTTPNPDDRALLITIAGPAITTVSSANAAYLVHARVAGTTARAAVFGRVGAGAVLRVEVPDVARSGAYSATVTEAADSTNAVRASMAGYSATVAP